jgi:hypothetical protein
MHGRIGFKRLPEVIRVGCKEKELSVVRICPTRPSVHDLVIRARALGSGRGES